MTSFQLIVAFVITARALIFMRGITEKIQIYLYDVVSLVCSHFLFEVNKIKCYIILVKLLLSTVTIFQSISWHSFTYLTRAEKQIYSEVCRAEKY